MQIKQCMAWSKRKIESRRLVVLSQAELREVNGLCPWHCPSEHVPGTSSLESCCSLDSDTCWEGGSLGLYPGELGLWDWGRAQRARGHSGRGCRPKGKDLSRGKRKIGEVIKGSGWGWQSFVIKGQWIGIFALWGPQPGTPFIQTISAEKQLHTIPNTNQVCEPVYTCWNTNFLPFSCHKSFCYT